MSKAFIGKFKVQLTPEQARQIRDTFSAELKASGIGVAGMLAQPHVGLANRLSTTPSDSPYLEIAIIGDRCFKELMRVLERNRKCDAKEAKSNAN